MCHLTLCLGQSHAVAGDDNDLLCLLQSGGNTVLIQLGFLLLLHDGSGLLGLSLGYGSLGGSGSGLTGEDSAQGAVHSLAHILGQDQTGSTHDTAYNDQQRIADGHTCNTACHTGQGVQEGNGNGHICTAHTHDEDHTGNQCRNSGQSRPNTAAYGLHDHAHNAGNQQSTEDQVVTLQALGAGI